jgi:hypothetical protein
MRDQSFAELYCAQNKIEPSRYERELLFRSLYPHARLVIWLILLTKPELMAADTDFVRSVGALRRFRDFENEAQEYAHHPGNRGFWRERCYVRVSTRALRRMVKETLHPSLASGTEAKATSSTQFGEETPREDKSSTKASRAE